MKKVRVWDLPLRLFHWVLALLLVAAVVTQNIGGNAMEWHFRIGYAVLTLIAFRILWGVLGPRYARFSSFIYGPSSILGYVRGKERGTQATRLGHNPLGGLSVLAMLGVVLIQAVSGLFANDDIAYDGPLVKFISKELSDRMTWFHADINAIVIYVLVALHLLAIAFYGIVKRRNLVKPMITGDQEIESAAPEANDSWTMRLWALVLLAVCAGAVYYVVTLPPSDM